MAIPSKPSYSHGSTGTEPASARDYQNGDPLDANEFDYYVNTPFEKIKDLIDTWNDYDSDDDGRVDAADNALTADSADAYKNNDIDTDGDGVVDAADKLTTGGSPASIVDSSNGSNLLTANEGGPVNVPVTLQEQGNDVLTTADEGSGNGLNADTVDGFEAAELGVDFEDNGSTVVANGTGANFTGFLTVTDDGDGTVTIDDSHNHDSRYYTETESDNRYVEASGDEFTGYFNARNGDRIGVPTYQSESDLPAGNEGDIAYVKGTDEVYVYTA